MTILTVALGLILTYLILSLIASSLQETISSWLSLRSKFLGQALDNMLTNKSTENNVLQLDKSLLDGFMNHVQFQSLKKGEFQQLPSYVSPKTFASILIQLLDGSDVKTLQASINDMNDGSLKTFLLSSLAEVGNDLAAFRKKLEEWFDEVMTRTSAWYKRYSHNTLIVIGLLLGAYFNADSLSMYQKMSQSSDAAQQTQQIVDLAQSMLGDRVDSTFNAQITALKATRAKLQTAGDSIDTHKLDSILYVQNQALIGEMKNFATELQANASPLGLGWSKSEWAAIKTFNLQNWLLKLLGLLVTAMAVSLGAPFWFDMLKHFMNIRNAGNQVEETKQKQ